MEKQFLWDGNIPFFEDKIGQEAPNLLPFLVRDGKAHGAMIVCPGGAYVMKCMDKEGTYIAEKLNAMGIHAFVLDYRVSPYHMPVMLLDAQRAIRFVRANADKFHVLPDHIGIMGFSAGGHLAASCGVHWDAGDDGAEDPVERVSCRPDVIAPCYGATNINRMRSADFNEYMTGKRSLSVEETRAHSPEYFIDSDTPPTFLFHTAEDDLVPVELSIEFAQRCADCNVPVELHVYPFGPHGIGLGDEAHAPGASGWSDLLGRFLHHHGF